MKKTLAAVVSALLLFAMGCGKTDSAARDQQAIRAAMQNYLAKHLNLSGMDTDVKNISIQQNTATAQVEFRSKEGSATMRMTMTYALERQGDAWVVRSGWRYGEIDVGHPPPGAAAPPAGMSELPPGHPPVGSEPAKTPPKKN